MHYIIQENLFREEGHEKLIKTLERFDISYELANVRPFLEDFDFKTKRKDVFIFGSLKMARLSEKYNFCPGTLIGDNHNYEVYSKHYKENLLNYDSRIVNFGDEFEWEFEQQFIRPTLDSKVFTGRVFDKNEWEEFREHQLINGHSTSLTKDTLIQVSRPKSITQEVRCWVVGGEVITQSTYRRGSFLVYDNIVDEDAIEFAQKMVDIFQLSDAFTIDVCLSNDEWKIVECGSISCAGFYDADMQKLIMALNDFFDTKEVNPVLDIEPVGYFEDDYVLVKAKHPEQKMYKEWTKVPRMVALGSVGVKMKEII